MQSINNLNSLNRYGRLTSISNDKDCLMQEFNHPYKNIDQFIYNDIVGAYAEYSGNDDCYTLDIKDVPVEEKLELAALIISKEELNIGEVWEFSQVNRIMINAAIINNLLYPLDLRSRDIISSSINNAILNFYEDKMRMLIDEQLNIFNADDKRNAGFSSYIDNQTGETLWQKD